MRNGSNRRALLIFCLIGIVPVTWLALLTAPFAADGLVTIIQKLPEAMDNPFHITLCRDSLKTILLFLLVY